MSKRGKHKPSEPRKFEDPAELARTRRNPASWGANDEALKLKANADVAVQEAWGEGGAAAIKRRVRYDVFALLFFATHGQRLGEASYLAVRRLQADIAVLHRTQGAGDAIRATGNGATGAMAMVVEDFSITRIAAGDRINVVQAGMEPWAAKLLTELCEAEAIRGQTPNWHAIVSRHTGEMDRAERGRLVRRACDDLAESYRRIDNEPREKVA